jgi:predicted integral membrane protein DUF2269
MSDVVLVLHLLSMVALLGTIAVFGTCYLRIRAADTLTEASPWARLADQAGWGFPPAILALFATGAYLTSHAWEWSTPWIVASIAGLLLVTLQGPIVGGPRSGALKKALDENEPGALDETTRRLARDTTLWIVLCANPGVVLGIIWDMTVKPGAAGAIAALVAGYALGVAAAFFLAKKPARATSTAPR